MVSCNCCHAANIQTRRELSWPGRSGLMHCSWVKEAFLLNVFFFLPTIYCNIFWLPKGRKRETARYFMTSVNCHFAVSRRLVLRPIYFGLNEAMHYRMHLLIRISLCVCVCARTTYDSMVSLHDRFPELFGPLKISVTDVSQELRSLVYTFK